MIRYFSWMHALAMLLVVTGIARESTERPAEVEINRAEPISAWPMMEAPTYDSEVSAQLLPGGALWAAWKTYHDGRETIVARLVKDRQRERFMLVSSEAGVCAGPQIVAFDEETAWFVWAQQRQGRWRIVARRFTKGALETEQLVSPADHDAVSVAAVRDATSGLVLAWQAEIAGRMTIQSRRFDGHAWNPVTNVSQERFDGFRPTIARLPGVGETWIFWDEYHRPNYEVYGRPTIPTLGATERISAPGDYAVKPESLATPEGELWLTWVRSVDVIGGDAVIDQSNYAQVAVRRDGHWILQRDETGNPDLACLDYGLLARLTPKPVPTGGYLGERRKPMLLEESGAVWLVYERKSDETGSTPTVTGSLVGRKHSANGWSELKTLTAGRLDYRPATHAATNGKWIFAASHLPREHRRIYAKTIVEPSRATPARDERIAGWQPVTLPLSGRPERRRQIEDGGRRLNLYWLDSHVHSALSADAEGEPDEILHYARDRSRLDVVVMQENDDMYDVPLTESEYTTGAGLARWASARGGLLALPGFEWTQILPTGNADPARPMFWQSSFRNHRTVIYPLTGGPLVRYTEAGNDITRLYDVVRRLGGVVHTQHETFLLGRDAEVEPAIEVTAGWAIYFLNPGRIHQALNDGYRKAFAGTSDSHRRNPGLGGGLTGVYAEALTDRKILEAYRDRRIFATSGSRVMVEARLNGVLMGRDVAVGDTTRLTLHAEAPRAIRRVVLVSNGRDLKAFPGESRTTLDLTHEEPAPKTGANWYYWRLELEGPGTNYRGNAATAEGNLAWSSPLWAVRTP